MTINLTAVRRKSNKQVAISAALFLGYIHEAHKAIVLKMQQNLSIQRGYVIDDSTYFTGSFNRGLNIHRTETTEVYQVRPVDRALIEGCFRFFALFRN